MRRLITVCTVLCLLVPATSSAFLGGKKGKKIYRRYAKGSFVLFTPLSVSLEPGLGYTRRPIGRRLTFEQTKEAINALQIPSSEKKALIAAWEGQSTRRTPAIHRTGGEELRWFLRPFIRKGDLVDSLMKEDNSILITVRRGEQDNSKLWPLKILKRMNVTRVRKDGGHTVYTPKEGNVWEVKLPDDRVETIRE